MSPPSAVRELLPSRNEEKARQGNHVLLLRFSILLVGTCRSMFAFFSFLFFLLLLFLFPFLFLLWDSESATPLSRSLLAWFASNLPSLFHFNRFFGVTLALPGRTIGFKI